MLMTGVAMTMRVVRREMELSRLQNDFVAAVSHEFKSPITGVRLLMERLQTGRTHSPERTATYYTAIGRELGRLERLVNRLLLVQQIQADGRLYRFRRESPLRLAQQAEALMQPLATDKDIRLKIEAEAGLPEIPMDEAAMLDVLENLLDNAVKYSPNSTTVTTSIRSEEDAVIIEVCDQGAGIDPAEQRLIFDKFYRGSNTDRYDVRGTGLGLALVKAVVEAHEGAVAVSSTPGKGSCFALKLPLHHSG
jgi:signal transduction histidine kinase